MIRLRWGAATDVGRLRDNNEDSLLVTGRLFAVADGMGGHRGGEVASQVAVDALKSFTDSPTTVAALIEAVQRANEAVRQQATDDPALHGMGTTMCALAVVLPADRATADNEEELVVVNVGDSRAYLFRDGDLTPITEDHSLVEEMVRDGRISPDEAALHPQRNIVTRALGIEPEVDVDSFPIAPYIGDRFLLCSDGLFDALEDDRIAATLRRLADSTESANELVRLANEAGGRDNITVVVIDVVDENRANTASAALADEPSTAESTSEHVSTVAPAVGLDESEVGSRRGGRRARRAARREAKAARPRRLTWRVAAFVLVLLVILGGAAGAVWWQARNTYYVGFRGDDVAIFQGRPGGVLWIDATYEADVGIRRREVPPARMAELQAGKEFGSRDEADRYVRNLREQVDRREGAAATPPATTTTTRNAAPVGPTPGSPAATSPTSP